MSNVVLGVCGSVAAYRACDLARELMRMGHSVRVCLTDSASRFVSPALFEALTGQPCLSDTFEEPVAGRMAHIDWARQADVVAIVPATANTIDKLAHGIGDDMLTTLALAFEGRTVIAPAMNPSMYGSEAVQSSLRTLAARGAIVIEPDEGDVACGESGQGKLASIERLADKIHRASAVRRLLEGRNVLITSGRTEEPLDIARVLTNRSSGRMGVAMAHAALLMGAEVWIVSGASEVPLPLRATSARVGTAFEMLDAAKKWVAQADFVVGVAAVADYRPESPIDGKLRSGEENLVIKLTKNPDILAELASAAKPGAKVVGFAAEPGENREVALEKLKRKALFAIAMNDVSRADIGFGSDSNELHVLFADGATETSGYQSKLGCALWLWERLAERK